MSKKNDHETPDSHWNYRVATRIKKYTLDGEKSWREFLFISAYYKKGILGSYGITNVGDGFEELESVKWTHGKLADALEKEVIDLDNFPNVWIPEKNVNN